MDCRSLFKAVAEAVAEVSKIKIFLLFLPQIIGKILGVLHFITLLKVVISHIEKNGLLRKYNIRILGGLDCWTYPDKQLVQDLVYKSLKSLLKSSIFMIQS